MTLSTRYRPLAGYGFALFAVVFALVVSLLFSALFQPFPFLLFLAAVALSAWFGGFVPGLLASLLSIVLVNQFFLFPAAAPNISEIDLERLVIFATVTFVASLTHSQQRRTLAALRQSRDQLNIYLQDMANGILVQDRSGRFVYANYEAAKIMGFVSSEALLDATGEQIESQYDLFDEFGAPFPTNSLPGKQALLGMKYPETVLRYRFKATGKERWAYVKARPIFDDRHEVQYAVSLFLDITELKQAQQKFDDQREQLHVTLRSIGDAVIATDAAGKITFVNPVAAALTGWAEVQALDKSIENVFHVIDEHTHLPIKDPVGQVLEQAAVVTLADQTVLVSRNRSERPIAVNAAPIRDPENHLIGAVLVFRDMTERRQAEANLRAQAQQQEVVAALGLRALAGADLGALMQEAAEQLTKTLQIEYAKVLELLPDGHALLLKAGVGWRDGLVGTATVDTGTSSQAGYTVLSNEPVVVEDLRAETRFHGPPLLLEHEVVSGMSVIIAGDKRPWGVLGAHTTRKRAFSKDDIHFVQAIANLLALALHRERIERAEREQRALAEALRDTAEALSSTLDLGQVLDRILENVERVVPHDATDIMLIDDDRVRVVRYRGYDERNMTEMIRSFQLSLPNTPTLKEMVSTCQPLIISETLDYAGWLRLPGMEWLRSYIGVPLIIDGHVNGFLNVSSVKPGFYTAEHANALKPFAAQATMALRNARLYDQARKSAGDEAAS